MDAQRSVSDASGETPIFSTFHNPDRRRAIPRVIGSTDGGVQLEAKTVAGQVEARKQSLAKWAAMDEQHAKDEVASPLQARGGPAGAHAVRQAALIWIRGQ